MKTLSTKKLAETVKNLRESKGYTKEELSELDEYMKVHIYTKEEYFANAKWETMEEWFEDVEYRFEEVA